MCLVVCVRLCWFQKFYSVAICNDRHTTFWGKIIIDSGQVMGSCFVDVGVIRIVTSAWKDDEGNNGNLYNLNIEHSCGWAVPSGFAKYDSDTSAQMTDLITAS